MRFGEKLLTDVLVTGGVGFIGYHLSNFLLEKDFNVTILDNFSNYYSEKIKRLNASDLIEKGAKIIEGSILEKKSLDKAIKKDCEIVFHFAAQPGVRYSISNPEISFRINVEGSSQVISFCKEKKIKKIVVASSSSVFGKSEYLPIDEKHPKNPISIYGISKLTVEQMVRVNIQLNPDLDISIIRPFTVIGSRQRPDMAINSFLSRSLKGSPIIIFGNGEQTRDWTHVNNIVEAAYLMATKEKARNEDFNIGSGIRTSVNDILKLISELTGKKLNIQYTNFNSADVKDTLADISKAKNYLDYEPKESLKIAINDFIKDYEDNLSKIV